MSETCPINPCYRARHQIAHGAHTWTNGIEVQYRVRCLGVTSPTPTTTEDHR